MGSYLPPGLFIKFHGQARRAQGSPNIEDGLGQARRIHVPLNLMVVLGALFVGHVEPPLPAPAGLRLAFVFFPAHSLKPAQAVDVPLYVPRSRTLERTLDFQDT